LQIQIQLPTIVAAISTTCRAARRRNALHLLADAATSRESVLDNGQPRAHLVVQWLPTLEGGMARRRNSTSNAGISFDHRDETHTFNHLRERPLDLLLAHIVAERGASLFTFAISPQSSRSSTVVQTSLRDGVDFHLGVTLPRKPVTVGDAGGFRLAFG
jgi:hypothetical protein